MILNCFKVVPEFYVDEYLTNKHPRAGVLRYQVRMFSQPAQTRPNCPGFVHHWGSIDANLTLDRGVPGLHPVEQFCKFLPYDVVIIVAPGISRDLARSPIIRVLIIAVIV